MKDLDIGEMLYQSLKPMNLHELPIKKPDAVNKLELYRDIDRQIKALEIEREALKKEFAETIFKDQDEYIYNGRLLATYKMTTRKDIDRKRLLAEKPDIYEQFIVEISYPQLRLK